MGFYDNIVTTKNNTLEQLWIEHDDMTFFETAISFDFKEAEAIKEGIDILPIQEAGISALFDMVVNTLKKFSASIDNIFAGFIAKYENYIEKEVKSYVDKYRDRINKKSNFNGMKAFFQEPTNKTGGYHPYVWGKDYLVVIQSTPKVNPVMNSLLNNNPIRIKSQDDLVDLFLSDNLEKQTNQKTYQYDMHILMYGPIPTNKKSDWSKKDILGVMNRLYTSDEVIKNLKEINVSLKKEINAAIDRIFNDRDKILTDYSRGKGDGTISLKPLYVIRREDRKSPKSKYATMDVPIDSAKFDDKDQYAATVNIIQTVLTLMQKEAYAHQKAARIYCNAVMNEAKWGLTQDRRIFAQAVGYSPKNESALLAEAMGDVAQWECESYFEDAEVWG